MLIRPERVVQWMNLVRQTSEDTQYRVLENFWGSQISSKCWMIDSIKQHLQLSPGLAYIMGGWYGVSAQFMSDNFPILDSVVSVDVDPQAELFGTLLSKINDNNDYNILFKTSDMESFTNYFQASIIINTSTEHITQKVFDTWRDNLPENVPIVLQGNNLFNCEDHIRCSTSLEAFNESNFLSKIIYTDSLLCGDFYRFMTIGYK